MADAEEIEENAQARPKRSKVPLILGLVLGLAGGGGGFYAAFAGLLPFGMPQVSPRHGCAPFFFRPLHAPAEGCCGRSAAWGDL